MLEDQDMFQKEKELNAILLTSPGLPSVKESLGKTDKTRNSLISIGAERQFDTSYGQVPPSLFTISVAECP